MSACSKVVFAASGFVLGVAVAAGYFVIKPEPISASEAAELANEAAANAARYTQQDPPWEARAIAQSEADKAVDAANAARGTTRDTIEVRQQ